MKLDKTRCGILAILTIIIWSSTFISTKVLLSAFTPIEILVYRFVLAWLLMFLVYPHVHRPESLKTELQLVLLGITGGTVYFLAENYALRISLASNVSLLVSTAPILTAVCAHAFLKNEKLSRQTVAGSVIAFAGVALVIFNGKFILKLNPLGDFLAILSSLSWAAYSIIIRKLETRRSTYYITRKIFFYTLVTVLPVLLIDPVRLDFRPLLEPKLALNLLFLTLFASCGAYVIWTKVIHVFGPTRANSFIYFIPLLTMTESAILLKEPLTAFSLAGALLIFAGVYTSSRVPNRTREGGTSNETR
jgi:drug/metabolite transporter (DMT)-like permease